MLSTPSANPNASHSNFLSSQERRAVHRIVDGDPRLYRRLKHDPRVGHAVADLLERYRQELIDAVQRGLEASLTSSPEPRYSSPPVAAPGGSVSAFARVDPHVSNASLSPAGEDDAGPVRATAPHKPPLEIEVRSSQPFDGRDTLIDSPSAAHVPEFQRRVALPADAIRTRRGFMTPLKYKLLVAYSSISTALVLLFVAALLSGLWW